MANRHAVEAWKAEIIQATVDGLTKGLRQNLPVAVGLLLIGPLVCIFMAFAHFALGVDWQPSLVIGGIFGALGAGAPATWRYFKNKGRKD